MTKTTYNSASSSTWFLPTNYKNMANISFTPTHDMHPATKKYVDDLIASGVSDSSNIEVINITSSVLPIDGNYYNSTIDPVMANELMEKHQAGKDIIIEYYFMGILALHAIFLSSNPTMENIGPANNLTGYSLSSEQVFDLSSSSIDMSYANIQLLTDVDGSSIGYVNMKSGHSMILPPYLTMVLTGNTVAAGGNLELGSVFYTDAESEVLVFLNGEKLIGGGSLSGSTETYHYTLLYAESSEGIAIEGITLTNDWSIVPEDVVEIMIRVKDMNS